MKLLVLTQSVDSEDTTLGFFHAWLERFSQRVDSLVVICLKEGAHELPANVRIFSLGKERRVGRVQYVFRFFKFIWALRNEYDAVFVHMNQEYLLLGGLYWKILGKKTALWYNHTHGTTKTDIACILADVVFYTSPYAYTAKNKNSFIMPAGVDTDFFRKGKADLSKMKNSILFLGRISPVKKVDLFVDALLLLKNKSGTVWATICGDVAPGDESYAKTLRTRFSLLEESGLAQIIPGVPHSETRRLYSNHELYVNLTQTGSLDKTVLEAMACESNVIVTNQSFKGVLPDDSVLEEKPSPEALQNAFTRAFSMSEEEKTNRGKHNRVYVEEKHSLKALVDKVLKHLS